VRETSRQAVEGREKGIAAAPIKLDLLEKDNG